MQDTREPYVKPAVLRLEYAADMPVSLAGSCKTNAGPASGSSPCNDGTFNSCITIGS